MAFTPRIPGFLSTPKKTASGRTYQGRFVCRDVQWTGSGTDVFGTFTVTAQELADAADGGMLWTDQGVQRGIRPEVTPLPPREISLSSGYPDPSKYIFDDKNADDMVEKLLTGEQVFFNPLVWNLRPGTFQAYWDHKADDLYVYSGRAYLPDSHHRHQAIVKAVHVWSQATREYPRFSSSRQFKIELYFLSREDEGNYFFDKNQRPKPTAKSKAYDLTTLDDLSLLAKKVIEQSAALRENVNRVTDRLTAGNPQVVTLSTLREMMRTFAAEDQLDASELEGLSTVAARFYELLAAVRPELGKLDVAERKAIRARLLVDSAVMMHGYGALMRDFNADLATLRPDKGERLWSEKLKTLSSSKQYTMGRWTGDFFDKNNPLWLAVGIAKRGRGQDLTTVNTGAARIEAGRVLRQLVNAPKATRDIGFLAQR